MKMVSIKFTRDMSYLLRSLIKLFQIEIHPYYTDHLKKNHLGQMIDKTIYLIDSTN